MRQVKFRTLNLTTMQWQHDEHRDEQTTLYLVGQLQHEEQIKIQSSAMAL